MENNNKKILTRIMRNRFVPYILITLLGIVITIPLFTMNLSELNEYRIHIIRVTNVREIIKQGIFPPFISFNHMMGFGYALNIFYGCLTTYIPIFISIFTDTNTTAIKIYTLLTGVLSGITMYIFTYKVTNKRTVGLVSALIYMAAPYRLTDVYARNAVGEYTAFIFIPMIFIGLFEIINENKKGNIWLISGASLLILTHTITTLYTAIFAALFLILNCKKLNKIDIWKNLIIDVIITVLLTSFYTIPIVEHKIKGNYIIYDANQMAATGNAVYNNTNNLSDWFRNELSVETESVYEDLVFAFGLVITSLTFITVFCIKKIDKKYESEYIDFLTLAIISLFMCTKLFPWYLMPHIISIIQFAWRLNGFFIFFISMVCGINAYVLGERLHIKKTTILIVITSIFVLGWFGANKYKSEFIINEDRDYEERLINLEKISVYNVNRDYMPLKANNNVDYLQNREDRTYILEGKCDITKENKETSKDKMEISNVENAKLELPYLYYQGYEVKINNKKIESYESENGFLCIDINENGNLEVEYKGTKIEKIGYIISLTSGLAIITVCIVKRSKEIVKDYLTKKQKTI